MVIEATKNNKNSYENVGKNNFKQNTRTNYTKPETISLDKFERAAQREEIKYERKQARKSRKNQNSDSAEPQTPVKVEPTKPASPEIDLKTYAEKYVSLYEKNTGTTLTQEQRNEKIKAVSEFYSAPSRLNRLETLVDSLNIAA